MSTREQKDMHLNHCGIISHTSEIDVSNGYRKPHIATDDRLLTERPGVVCVVAQCTCSILHVLRYHYCHYCHNTDRVNSGLHAGNRIPQPHLCVGPGAQITPNLFANLPARAARENF